ncbi:hypothetical protein JW905_07520, partial [bacterium]|nr:hypothetical protein [candidate division CSSED10-310 bacterium]
MRKAMLAGLIMVVLTGTTSADWQFTKLSETILGSRYYDLWIDGDYLYTAAKRAVEIYSLADPAAPQLVAQLTTPGLANGVHVAGEYLYIGDVYGFHIADISDPTAPVIIGSFSSNDDGYQERVRVRGDYAYVAAYNAGLQVFDVSDRTRPRLAGAGDTSAYAWYVAVDGDLAAIADTFAVEFFDISDPRLPIHLSTYPAMFGLEVELRDGLAYIAYIDGMIILDMSDPANPTPVGAPGITGNGVCQT